jgi:branched-subunit amino acid transport protein
MKKTTKLKKGAWFIKIRGSYLPDSWQGWLTYVPFVIFLVGAYVVGTGSGHSVATAIYQVVPAWVAAGVVMTWIAARKS